VVTSPGIPGYRVVEVLEIVTGSSVRTRGVGGRLMAGVEAMLGGRSEAYLMELEKARDEALRELVDKTARMSGNAVISVDFETTQILEGFIVVTVYGTAFTAVPEQG